MVYTKTTWAHDTKFTTTNLNNCETQYDEAYGGAVAHTHDGWYYTRTECDAWFWYAGNDGAGSTCDADLLYYASGNKHYADFGAGGVAQYTIALWDNAVLPSGWVRCDGTGGTPDLRDYFVVGAGGAYAVGASGGSNTWTQNYTITVASYALLTADMPSHRHGWTEAYPQATGAGGGSPSTCSVLTNASGNTSSVGGGASHGHTSSYATQTAMDNKPPCVALYYIMKS